MGETFRCRGHVPFQNLYSIVNNRGNESDSCPKCGARHFHLKTKSSLSSSPPNRWHHYLWLMHPHARARPPTQAAQFQWRFLHVNPSTRSFVLLLVIHRERTTSHPQIPRSPSPATRCLFCSFALTTLFLQL